MPHESMSQSEIDDLLKKYLEPSKSNSINNFWVCEKCKSKNQSGKSCIIKSDGNCKIGVLDESGKLIYRAAISKGITQICLKCGYFEIFIAR